MNYSKFIADIQAEFYLALDAKTNWSRNDLKMAFERAIIRVMAKYLENLGDEILLKK